MAVVGGEYSFMPWFAEGYRGDGGHHHGRCRACRFGQREQVAVEAVMVGVVAGRKMSRMVYVVRAVVTHVVSG